MTSMVREKIWRNNGAYKTFSSVYKRLPNVIFHWEIQAKIYFSHFWACQSAHLRTYPSTPPHLTKRMELAEGMAPPKFLKTPLTFCKFMPLFIWPPNLFLFFHIRAHQKAYIFDSVLAHHSQRPRIHVTQFHLGPLPLPIQ